MKRERMTGWWRPLAALVLLLLAGCTPQPQEPVAEEPPRPVGEQPQEPVAAEALLVSAVIDGDTIDVATPGGVERVRLLGINAPERSECFGQESTARLAALLATGELALERDRSDRDRYGRLLRYVDAGGDAGEALIRSGHALAVATEPDTARAERYAAAQQEARAAGRGLWAAGACGEAAAGADGLRISGLEANPPGPDGDRLNGEWVEIRNAGAAAVDLSGFVVRDESSSNRYTLPAGTVLAAGASLRLHSGCGQPDATALYWCSGGPIWNNGGDTAFLLDRAGNITASLAY